MKDSVIKKFRELIDELIEIVEHPLQIRVLEAFHTSPNPLEAMEKELGEYLIEILDYEDN